MVEDHSEFPNLHGELFREVQLAQVFDDQKSFTDAVPRTHPTEIIERYYDSQNADDFNINNFVESYFQKPSMEEFQADDESIIDYIESLWPVLLTDETDANQYTTRIELPNPHTAPSGRFREGYYWDTYFTAEGLIEHGETEQVKWLLDNFKYLIEEFGFIPNGNRIYYTSRSQPPFFFKLLQLYNSAGGNITKYLPALETEYNFWMSGERTVDLAQYTLNRYWDELSRPRPEGYRQDYLQAQELPPEDRASFYKNKRAACESGWDFSSRWLENPNEIQTIRTTEIIPVDLNALLWEMEHQLYEWTGRESYEEAAINRKKAIYQFLWDGRFFTDYHPPTDTQTSYTLAGVVPLFTGLAETKDAYTVADVLSEEFLYEGGLVTTKEETGEQWDYPNGWAPLQWMAIEGLYKYDRTQLNDQIKRRWMNLVENTYDTHKKLYEKYDVVSNGATYEKGEYPLQSGFGWTNGTYVAMKNNAHKNERHKRF